MTWVTTVTKVTRVTRLTTVTWVTWVIRVTWVTWVTRVIRVTWVTRVTKVIYHSKFRNVYFSLVHLNNVLSSLACIRLRDYTTVRWTHCSVDKLTWLADKSTCYLLIKTKKDITYVYRRTGFGTHLFATCRTLDDVPNWRIKIFVRRNEMATNVEHGRTKRTNVRRPNRTRNIVHDLTDRTNVTD